MQYSLIFVGAGAFAAFAHAQAPTHSLFFSTMPKQDEKLLIGEPIKVDYKAPSPGAVKITLLRGAPLNQHAYKVLSTTETSGSYTFTPDPSYPLACDYALQIDQEGQRPYYSSHFCFESAVTPSGTKDVETSTKVSGGITSTTHVTSYVTSTVTSTTTTCTDSSSVVTTQSAAPVYDSATLAETSAGVVGPSAGGGTPSLVPVVTPIAGTPVAGTPTPAPAGPTQYTPGSGASNVVVSGVLAGVLAVAAAVALL